MNNIKVDVSYVFKINRYIQFFGASIVIKNSVFRVSVMLDRVSPYLQFVTTNFVIMHRFIELVSLATERVDSFLKKLLNSKRLNSTKFQLNLFEGSLFAGINIYFIRIMDFYEAL